MVKLKYLRGDVLMKCNTYESGIRNDANGEVRPAGDSPYGCVDMVGNGMDEQPV
jgi:hypothetical protein